METSSSGQSPGAQSSLGSFLQSVLGWVWVTVLFSTSHCCTGHTSHLFSVTSPMVTSLHFSMLTVTQLGNCSSTS